MKTKSIIGSALALVGASGMLVMALNNPVWAGDKESSEVFVDRDFQAAVRKHIEKRLFHLIDANDEQRQQITAILDQRFAELQPQREKLRSEAIELSQMMSSETSDEKITDKVHEIRGLRDKLMDERLTTALKVRALLNSEQRKVLSDRIVALLSGNASPRMVR
ncbi:MAG TPA: periplasmic heavy metal sensor [Drouetiella sp.]